MNIPVAFHFPDSPKSSPYTAHPLPITTTDFDLFSNPVQQVEQFAGADSSTTQSSSYEAGMPAHSYPPSSADSVNFYRDPMEGLSQCTHGSVPSMSTDYGRAFESFGPQGSFEGWLGAGGDGGRPGMATPNNQDLLYFYQTIEEDPGVVSYQQETSITSGRDFFIPHDNRSYPSQFDHNSPENF